MMTTTKRTGALCLTAAALVVSSETLRLVVGLVWGPDATTTTTHTLTYALALAGMYALLLALTAVYVRSRSALGRLGLVGYLCAALGIILVAGDWWFEAFVVPIIAAQAPGILHLAPGGSLLTGALITVGSFAVGWILFGLAVFRSGIFSRSAGGLLIIGGACGAPLALSSPYQIPLAMAVGWLGVALMRASRRELPVPQSAGTARHVPGAVPTAAR
jgi:hypothetical protein